MPLLILFTRFQPITTSNNNHSGSVKMFSKCGQIMGGTGQIMGGAGQIMGGAGQIMGDTEAE